MLELRGTLVPHRTLRYRFGFDKLASLGRGERLGSVSGYGNSHIQLRRGDGYSLWLGTSSPLVERGGKVYVTPRLR